MARLERELAETLRRARGGEATPEVLLRLGRLHMRAGQLGDARAAFARARETIRAGSPLVRDGAGEVAGLHPLWTELDEALAVVDAQLGREERAARRRELQARLERQGHLPREDHDALIRLEVADGLAVHREEPRCPACDGPIRFDESGAARCARTGRGGDLCRHTDAVGLFACAGCGLVVRAWSERPLRAGDPREPPMVQPERGRCPRCGGRVADWSRHFLRCPKARPADFPRCDVCRGRGHHARTLRCPRCRTAVAEVPCAERRGK